MPSRTRPATPATRCRVSQNLPRWSREEPSALRGMARRTARPRPPHELTNGDPPPMSRPSLFKGRLSIPVIGSPLFIISVPDLVIAQCKAGIVGSFPALNARPPALLEEWLVRIKQELAAHDKAHPERPSAPVAGNQIVHSS